MERKHTLIDNAAEKRYELDLGDGMALAEYVLGHGLIVLTHTEVPPKYEGRGIGKELVQGVLEVWLLHADQRLNALISSDQRATLISVDSMAYSILMIPASPFVGAVGDLFGQAGAGLAMLGVLTAASGAAVLAKRRS